MNETSTPFIHLKAHSEYSLCDGILRLKPLVEHVKSLRMPAVAVTDHFNLFGLVKFYNAARSAGVKPIIGADLSIHEGGKRYTVTALCLNHQGYQNLTKLLSKAYVDGQIDDQPTIQRAWLQELNAGLIILSGAQFGDVGQAILQNKPKLIRQRLQFWQQHFANRYYLELQRVGRANENDYIKAATHLAAEHQIPVVATNDVRFLQEEDFEAHEARVCIHDSYVLNDHRRPKRYSEQQYLKSCEQMHELFSDIPEAIANTYEIAKRCTLSLTLGKPCLPKFPVPAGE